MARGVASTSVCIRQAYRSDPGPGRAARYRVAGGCGRTRRLRVLRDGERGDRARIRPRTVIRAGSRAARGDQVLTNAASRGSASDTRSAPRDRAGAPRTGAARAGNAGPGPSSGNRAAAAVLEQHHPGSCLWTCHGRDHLPPPKANIGRRTKFVNPGRPSGLTRRRRAPRARARSLRRTRQRAPENVEVRDGRKPQLVLAERQQQMRDPVARRELGAARLHAVAVHPAAAWADQQRARLADQPQPSAPRSSTRPVRAWSSRTR